MEDSEDSNNTGFLKSKISKLISGYKRLGFKERVVITIRAILWLFIIGIACYGAIYKLTH